MVRRFAYGIFVVLLLGVFLSSFKLAMAVSYTLSGTALSLNTGNYLKFSAYNSNVTMDMVTGNFAGYAFSEDLGWIDFGTIDNPSGPVMINTGTGAITGKAKVLNTGNYLDFTGYSSNVTFNSATGMFSGFGYSEDGGWFDFSSTGVIGLVNTFVGDTLSSSRLSFAGRVLSVAGNLVSINPTGISGFSSTSSANLRVGDSILINGVSHSVQSIQNTANNQFFTASVPSASAGNPIYYLSKPTHTITFTSGTTIPSGFFRVLIPASTGTNNDGTPDPDGFDFNSMASAGKTTYASATNATGFTFDTSNIGATVSGGTNCIAGYHCFEFHYTGAGTMGTQISLVVGNATSSLIAPSPKLGHDIAIADSYPVFIQQFSNGTNPSTSTPVFIKKGSVALIEPVRITLTVEPLISFQIVGVAAGVSACGVTTNVSTQLGVEGPLTVPFGSLPINSFVNAAHTMMVSTNAVNGYVVTVQENRAMGLNGGATTTIPNTTCDSGSCTYTSNSNWVTAAGHPGFGYSLESVSGATVPFTAGASFSAKAFPSAGSGQPAQIVMSGSTVADAHTANLCYRISVDATQPAGNYENQITYTATASF